MFEFLGPSARAVAIVLAIGSAAYAQQPAPKPPPTPPEAPPLPEEPPSDPLPAGVGSAEAPKPDAAEGTVQEQPNETSKELLSKPFTGLFAGAAPRNPKRRDALDLSASLFAVHLTNLPVGSSEVPDPTLVTGTSNYGGGGAALDYSHFWEQADVHLSGDDSVAYVSELTDEQGGPWVNRWAINGDTSFTHQLNQRTSAHGGVQVRYSPYYQQGLLTPGQIPSIGQSPVQTPGADFVVAKNPSISSNFVGGLSYSLTRRSSIEGLYTLARWDFLENDADSLRDQLILGRYVYRVSQYLNVHAGYGYRTSRSGPTSESTHSHQIDAGADAGRSFRLARRTTFSFSTGTSVFSSPNNDGNDGANGTNTQFVFLGNVALIQSWAKSWSANVGAGQNVQFEPGFSGPLLSDQVYGGFGGLLAPRLDFTAQANYATGNVGFGSTSNGYNSSSATGTLRLALTRDLAAYAQGFYYRYSFESGVVLPTFLQPGLERYGVSVGLTTWIPLIGGQRHR